MKTHQRFFNYGLLLGGALGFGFSVATALVGPSLLALLVFPIWGGLLLVFFTVTGAEDAAAE